MAECAWRGSHSGVDAVERPGEVVERRPAKSLHRSPRGATDLPEVPTRGTAPDSLSGTDHHGARLGWLRDTTPRQGAAPLPL
jgi:hypothetical protein